MEIKEKQNREILQAYMKYELGVTGQAVSTISRRFMCIKNFLKMLEQKRTLAVHATAEDLSDYAKDRWNTMYRQRDLTSGLQYRTFL